MTNFRKGGVSTPLSIAFPSYSAHFCTFEVRPQRVIARAGLRAQAAPDGMHVQEEVPHAAQHDSRSGGKGEIPLLYMSSPAVLPQSSQVTSVWAATNLRQPSNKRVYISLESQSLAPKYLGNNEDLGRVRGLDLDVHGLFKNTE